MKYIRLAFMLLAACVCLGACHNQPDNKLYADEIYFFYQTTCPHCHHAQAYIDQKYPDLKMVSVNIADKNGFELFAKCAKKFKLGNKVGTPLFCMGDKYLMGWAPEYEATFDAYVKPFLK